MEGESWVTGGEVLDVTRLRSSVRENPSEYSWKTYGDPVWDQITFVDNEDNLLVGFLLFDIFENGVAHRSKRIARIQDVENHVRRIYDLVQLSVNSTGRAFGINWLIVVSVSGRIDCQRLP